MATAVLDIVQIMAPAKPTKKKCGKCRRRKLLTLFNRNSGTRDGRQRVCMACQRDYAEEQKARGAGRGMVRL